MALHDLLNKNLILNVRIAVNNEIELISINVEKNYGLNR